MKREKGMTDKATIGDDGDEGRPSSTIVEGDAFRRGRLED